MLGCAEFVYCKFLVHFLIAYDCKVVNFLCVFTKIHGLILLFIVVCKIRLFWTLPFKSVEVLFVFRFLICKYQKTREFFLFEHKNMQSVELKRKIHWLYNFCKIAKTKVWNRIILVLFFINWHIIALFANFYSFFSIL